VEYGKILYAIGSPSRKIEAKMALFPELSLAARRLIAEPARKIKPKPDLMVAWRKATAEELTRHFDAVTVVGLLRVISLAFRRELEGRLRKRKLRTRPSLTTSSPWCSAPPSGAENR
jgi:hypothetical protein